MTPVGKSSLPRILAISAACVAGACDAGGTPADVPLCAASSGLIDGRAAPQAAFAAIGSLGRLDQHGSYRAFCSATLIAPDLILTAKHCTTLAPAPLVFALGANARAPERWVAVRERHASEPQTGGVAQMGSDIALARLAEAITDVAPLRVTPAAPEELLGVSLQALGYGTSDATCVAESAGARRIGEQIVTRVHGNVFDHIYGNYATYLAVASGGKAPDAVERRYQHGWLLDGYEMWVEPGRGHAQLCNGDSGGPVLRMSGPTPEVVGVSSWVWHSDQAICDYGAAIALIGPQTRQMLDALQAKR